MTLDDSSAVPYNFGSGSWATINKDLHAQVLLRREQLVKARQARTAITRSNYWVYSWQQKLAVLLAPTVRSWLEQPLTADGVSLAFVGREQYGADLCVTIPAILKAKGSKEYIGSVVPALVKSVSESTFIGAGGVEKVEAKGIYLNLRLKDSELFTALSDVKSLGTRFGEGDNLANSAVVIDYSSPNAAKLLHAGHIRSTILGEVLAKLYEHCGALVHRVNHINDLGGFGFLLEGYRRWENLLPSDRSPNERLAILYGFRRLFERVVAAPAQWQTLSLEDRTQLEHCFGALESFEAFKAHYTGYVAASDERYRAFEQGDSEEIALWKKMVRWSLDDFETFYELLGVHHDYVIGESFYAADGRALVEQALKQGTAYWVTPDVVAREKARLQAALEQKKINEREYETRLTTLQEDAGACVIGTGEFDRCVVFRSDGATIYATRDLGVVHYRRQTFAPQRSLYIVGKEQELHFQNVFAATEKLGVVGGTQLEHIYTGFYVDPQTKKKLSSRDGASNVNRLLRETIAYFSKKLEANPEIGAEERARSARNLGVGSVVLNDIRKDKKNNVDIPAQIEKAVEDFEKSGGAYLMYSVCRAKSILRKLGASFSRALDIDADPSEVGSRVSLEAIEIELLKKVLEFPRRVAAAAASDNPSLLVTHLIEIAQHYNTYYNSFRVIEGDKPVAHRVLLHQAVARTIENGLRFCHIECPERM